MPRAAARPKPADDSDDAPLKRLGGGRWQTRDERFTIEPQSGTWVVVDAEQTDDFGMALVRGPYPSLTEAKLAIAAARTSAPAASPLAGRIERRSQPDRSGAGTAPRAPEPKNPPTPRPAKADRSAKRQPADATPAAPTAAKSSRAKPEAKPPAEPSEPGWLTDLQPARRGRARRLIARLDDAGVADAVSVVRRDVLGDVPAIAAIAIARRLADLGDDIPAAAVAELLADGRDEALGVRWRLVDGDGRPITLESARRRR